MESYARGLLFICFQFIFFYLPIYDLLYGYRQKADYQDIAFDSSDKEDLDFVLIELESIFNDISKEYQSWKQ